jgi:nucleoid DNA-binding protein
MNKAQLTEKLAEQCNIPKVRAAQYINILVNIISQALVEGEQKVTISDFGTFTVSQRREFTGHNPKTRSQIRVPARRIPVFRAGKGLKESLNQGLE